MFCSGCGTQLTEDDRFCRRCGRARNGSGPAANSSAHSATRPPVDVGPSNGGWTQPLQPEDEATLAAVKLSRALQDGVLPQPISAPITLAPAEQVYAQVVAQVFEYTAIQVGRTRGTFVGFGSPLLLGATLAGSLVYNKVQKERAKVQAAPQWRPVDQGVIYFTTTRLAFQGTQGWSDVPYSAIRAMSLENDGILISLDGAPRLAFSMHSATWHFVLMRYLASGEVVPLTVDPGLRLRAELAGVEAPS